MASKRHCSQTAAAAAATTTPSVKLCNFLLPLLFNCCIVTVTFSSVQSSEVHGWQNKLGVWMCVFFSNQ